LHLCKGGLLLGLKDFFLKERKAAAQKRAGESADVAPQTIYSGRAAKSRRQNRQPPGQRTDGARKAWRARLGHLRGGFPLEGDGRQNKLIFYKKSRIRLRRTLEKERQNSL